MESSNLASLVQDEMQRELSTSTAEAQAEFFNWVTGQISDPPDSVKRVVSNITQKINVTMGYLTAMNLSRMNRISNFMAVAEEELFSSTRVASMSPEELSKMYDRAQKILATSMDFSRKFIFQNKDLDASTEVDEIKTLLGSLPPDRLKQLKEFLERGALSEESEAE